MPIYEYQCEACGESHEVFQKMSDDPLEVCERCGGKLRKVLHPVAIHFKGSGFYTTDYGRGSKRRSAGSSDGAAGDDGASAAGSDSAGAVKPADKPADKSAKSGSDSKAKTAD